MLINTKLLFVVHLCIQHSPKGFYLDVLRGLIGYVVYPTDLIIRSGNKFLVERSWLLEVACCISMF